MRILVFGDSVAHGFWDEQGGWVQRLKSLTDKKAVKREILSDDYVTFYDLNISGDTTEEVLRRFEHETMARIPRIGNKGLVIIFAIGFNDSYEIVDKKENIVLENKFRDNLLVLISLAKKYTSKIFFVGLTPVDEPKVTRMPWTPEFSYHNEQIELYDSVIKEVCEQNNIYFIDILKEFKKQDYLELLEDGAHPNTQGHETIYEKVKSFLENKGVI